MNIKQVAILVTNNAVGSELMGVKDFFEYANSFWQYMYPADPHRLFECELYSVEGKQVQCSNGFILPCRPIDELQQADIMISVAAYTYSKSGLKAYLQAAQPMYAKLKQAVAGGTWVASHCSGTFSLAEAGLLDNRQATTCWWLKEVFAQRYPQVRLKFDELVVRSDNIITGGATTSFLNVCMAILEEIMGFAFANNLSKLLLMDRHRLSQQAFIDPELVIGHRDSLMEQVQQWMRQHYAEPFNLDELCDRFAVTKRTLIRRFKAATGETPLAYLQQIRVEKAKGLLQATDLPIERIVEKVGYGDPASFRKLFVNLTQLTPKAYRQRFAYQPRLSA
ncbi:GlxA family transcriptional regulator [Bowmanella dokdonensis]